MNTIILDKDKNGNQYPIDIFSKMVQSRTIYINNMIDSKKATDIIATLLYLKSQPSKDPTVNIFLNSDTNSVRNVLMLTDVFRTIDLPIRVIGTGFVIGTAVLLLATANNAQATENCTIQFGPLDLYPAASSIDEADSYMKRIRNDSKQVMKLISKKIGRSLKETEALFSKDVFMSAKEAKKIGLIDSIVKGSVK